MKAWEVHRPDVHDSCGAGECLRQYLLFSFGSDGGACSNGTLTAGRVAGRDSTVLHRMLARQLDYDI